MYTPREGNGSLGVGISSMSFLIPSSVQTMSSLEIAELTGKRHDNVKADVQKLLEELNLQPPEFQEV